MLHIFLFLAVLIISSCGGNDDSTFSEALIGPEGGTVKSADGSLSLEIPAGALPSVMPITIEQVHSASPTLKLYELGPEGLEFAMPARMTVNVTDIMDTSDASALEAAQLPVIFSSNRSRNGAEGLENHLLTMNSDTGTFSLSADVEHFSRFAIGGNLDISFSIDNVPQFWQANTAFGPVQITVVNGDSVPTQSGAVSPERLNLMFYIDSSVAPVIFNGSSSDVGLRPVPDFNETQIYTRDYACGDPGIGIYRARINAELADQVYVTYRTVEEINIAAAFIFAFDEAITGGESRTTLQLRSKFYSVQGTRQVNCGGSEPVGETPEPTATPNEEASPTAIPTTEPTGEPTTEPTPEEENPEEAPQIESSASVNIDHTRGETDCPTPGQTITVTTDSEAPLEVSVNNPLSFLTVSPASGVTSNGQIQFSTAFPCSGFSPGANRGGLSITATNPATGASSNTVSVPVIVTVN